MTDDLERVTKLAEECGAQRFNVGLNYPEMRTQFQDHELLAYTQKVEQAVLAKRDEGIEQLHETIRSLNRRFVNEQESAMSKERGGVR